MKQNNTVLNVEHFQDETQYFFEGDVQCLEFIKLLQGRVTRLSKYKHLSTKVKRGFGKGKPSFQKVKIKSNNSIDNLTWCR